MKVRNFTNSPNGAPVPNQFIITGEHYGQVGEFFQSYTTVIAFRPASGASITLDREAWEDKKLSSRTTTRYRNKFLARNTRHTAQDIINGSIILADLNS